MRGRQAHERLDFTDAVADAPMHVATEAAVVRMVQCARFLPHQSQLVSGFILGLDVRV